jgi:hypothetical protein
VPASCALPPLASGWASASKPASSTGGRTRRGNRTHGMGAGALDERAPLVLAPTLGEQERVGHRPDDSASGRWNKVVEQLSSLRRPVDRTVPMSAFSEPGAPTRPVATILGDALPQRELPGFSFGAFRGLSPRRAASVGRRRLWERAGATGETPAAPTTGWSREVWRPLAVDPLACPTELSPPITFPARRANTSAASRKAVAGVRTCCWALPTAGGCGRMPT